MGKGGRGVGQAGTGGAVESEGRRHPPLRVEGAAAGVDKRLDAKPLGCGGLLPLVLVAVLVVLVVVV